jgi:hypothetical protein
MAKSRKREVRSADRVIRRYIEGDPTFEVERGEAQDIFATDADSGTGRKPLRKTLEEVQPSSPSLSGGDVDAAWDQADSGEETVGGSHATPDQDIVEEQGQAMGVTYEDTEPLDPAEKIEARDEHRWELNPVSAEDYAERQTESEQESGGSTKRGDTNKRQTGKRQRTRSKGQAAKLKNRGARSTGRGKR